ncbi:MAG: hypothetical protein OHK0013_16770 [Sandaracinaceae bacterium]
MPTTHPIADRPSLPVHRPSLTNVLAGTRLLVLAAMALAVGGCNGAFIGNFVVLGLTLGVFFGTLGLGRAQTRASRGQGPSQSSAERSHSDV